MNIVTIDEDIIYSIHQNLIDEFGGYEGIFDNTEAKIQSIVQQQYPSFGYDKYPTIFSKAAMLMYFIIKDHCFVDGNKRTGVTIAGVFLTLNGYELNMTQQEFENTALTVAKSNKKGEEIDNFIMSISLKLKFKSKKIC